MPTRRPARRSPQRTPARSRRRATPLRRQLADALDRERALADILRVINGSPAAPEPVFEAILDHALRLCASPCGLLYLYDGESFRRVAHRGASEFVDRPTLRPGPHTGLARAVAARRPVHILDMTADRAYVEGDPARLATVKLLGARTGVWVPLLREGVPVGVISIWRQKVRAFTPEQIDLLAAFASQAVIAVENARLFQALDARNRELTEALDRETATSEILRVISGSPTDIQPVFDAIARHATRLCAARFSALVRVERNLVRLVAHDNVPAEWLEIATRNYPAPLSDPGASNLSMLERRIVHIPDLEEEPRWPGARELGRAAGYRSVLYAPMLRDDVALGTIGVTKDTPFTDKQIALLRTFADQAVIAVENVRLFQELQARNRELTEALEQQTATSEVLKVISRSTFDIEPVLATLIENAARLCGASMGFIFRVDGESLVLATAHNVTPDFQEVFRRARIRPGRGTLIGRTALERRVVHIPDVLADPEYEWHEAQQVGRYRTVLNVPMLREGVLLGVIAIHREEVEPFTERQIELVTTFADQAVIAIENVRLLQELQARNRELTEALEQQTATSEILRVISSSPTDAQPVFDTIADNAVRLCEAAFAYVFRFDGTLMHVVAHHNLTSEALAALERQWPMRPDHRSVPARAILDRRVVHVADVLSEPDHPYLATSRALGIRSMLTVPMLRDGEPIGAIAVFRQEVSPFSEQQVALVATFASQAVIAIENVRLFQELQARNRELTEALEQQTATSEVLKVISRSAFDLQPVLETLIDSATRLCRADKGFIFRLEDDVYRLAVDHGASPEFREFIRQNPIRLGRGTIVGRTALERRTVPFPDVLADPEYTWTDSQRVGRFRSALGVPMLREGVPIGVMAMWREHVEPFTDKQIELVTTFADQAVIAIENVRLFQELQTRNRELTESLEQQTATSEVLKVISRSTFDLEPVLETLIENATRLCEAQRGVMYRRDGELFRSTAAYNTSAELRAFLEESPHRPGRDSAVGRVALDHQVVNIPDVTADPEYRHPASQIAGLRAVLAVPMFREGALIGAMGIWSDDVRVFTPKQIELVTTFADQAVIAIENVRLLRELRARTDELARSVQELRALGEVGQAVNSTLDLDTVLTTIVARAVELSATDGGAIYEFDEAGQEFLLRATHGMSAELIEAVRETRIRAGETAVGRAAAARRPVQVPDMLEEAPYPLRAVALKAGFRAFLVVPLVREEQVVGALVVRRRTPGEFPEATVNLLQTFAAQSVLAIQNARLFRELEEKSRQLEVASRHKSQFLANMSHELRTPLNAILGYTELILDSIYGEIPGRAREVMERIDKSGRHLLGLINDVLDLSKIEAGQLTLTRADYSLRDVVHTVATAVEALAAEKQLALKVVIAPDLPRGHGDERRLAQVLLNLVGNAIKFTEAGEVRVEATAADGRFLVAVTDTGPGISVTDQERIFEEFQQADTSSTRKKGGTGLGLSIARRIVEMHGGRLWVESEPGKGATFRFTVPVRA